MNECLIDEAFVKRADFTDVFELVRLSQRALVRRTSELIYLINYLVDH